MFKKKTLATSVHFHIMSDTHDWVETNHSRFTTVGFTNKWSLSAFLQLGFQLNHGIMTIETKYSAVPHGFEFLEVIDDWHGHRRSTTRKNREFFFLALTESPLSMHCLYVSRA